jgi:hypothetical protein
LISTSFCSFAEHPSMTEAYRLREDPARAAKQGEAKQKFDGFPKLPGFRLRWERTHHAGDILGLLSENGLLLASVAARTAPAGFDIFDGGITLGDAVYGFRHDSPQRRLGGSLPPGEPPFRDLVNFETGKHLLRVSGEHFDLRATTVIEFPSSRRLTLPVETVKRQWSWQAGLMTAIDEAGQEMMRLRRTAKTALLGTEIVVGATEELSTETICVGVLASSLMATSYFRIGGG